MMLLRSQILLSDLSVLRNCHSLLPEVYSYHRNISSRANMSNRPDITLYTAQTPNGIKISIALEELGYVV